MALPSPPSQQQQQQRKSQQPQAKSSATAPPPPPLHLQKSVSSTTPTITNRIKLSLLNSLDDPNSDFMLKQQQQQYKQKQKEEAEEIGGGLGSGIHDASSFKSTQPNPKILLKKSTSSTILSSTSSSNNYTAKRKSHAPVPSQQQQLQVLPQPQPQPPIRRASSYKQQPTCSSKQQQSTPEPQAVEQQQPSGGRSPKSVHTALKYYGQYLSDYEKHIEIHDYQSIYFVGPHAQTKHGTVPPPPPPPPPPTDTNNNPNNHAELYNFGFDDDRGDYKIVLQDHLAYRYEIVDILGRGSFGQVVKCFDHKTTSMVAIKLIRNKKRFHAQAIVEVNILKKLVEWDPEDEYNTIQMTDHFYFRNHLCIAFELLSMNLYEFIKSNHFQGFSLSLIRRFVFFCVSYWI